jgi:hypothetical protein
LLPRRHPSCARRPLATNIAMVNILLYHFPAHTVTMLRNTVICSEDPTVAPTLQYVVCANGLLDLAEWNYLQAVILAQYLKQTEDREVVLCDAEFQNIYFM